MPQPQRGSSLRWRGQVVVALWRGTDGGFRLGCFDLDLDRGPWGQLTLLGDAGHALLCVNFSEELT